MAKRERISSVDTAWLRMDRPHNLMQITGVMTFAGRIDRGRLLRTIEARMLGPYPRFRRRAVADATGYWWEDDPAFELEAHVHRTALPGAADKAELEELAAELVATPLDPGRPLWQFHLVENYRGGSALIARIHHCIADGIALVGVMLSLTDTFADAPAPPGTPAPAQEEPEPDPWSQLLAPVTETMTSAIKWSGAFWSRYWEMLFNPQQALDYLRTGGAVASELATLAILPDDTPTRFKGKPGTSKRVAWSEPLPLGEIKALGKAMGCSVNDILLASVAGALRAYQADRGDRLEGCEIRALVPVNLREPGQAHQLGNRFGLVALLLPVGEENPFARLFEVRSRMEALKTSYQAPVTLGLLGVLGMAPQAVQNVVLNLLAAKATAVVTNVPGPQQPLYLCGCLLTQQMFWVPQSGDIGMGVSILSYDGRVQFGLITDKRLVPDPQSIVDRVQPEFEKLLLASLMEPWDRQRDPAEIAASLEAEKAPARKAAPRTRKAPPPGGPAPAAAAPRVPKRFR